MAIEYDSDDIGELDEDLDNAIQGAVSVDQYDKLLNKFLDDHPTSNHVHEAGFEYHTAASDGTNHVHDTEAIEKVCFSVCCAESYRDFVHYIHQVVWCSSHTDTGLCTFTSAFLLTHVGMHVASAFLPACFVVEGRCIGRVFFQMLFS